MSVNGAVIHVVRPVVDRAKMERGTIIPRQYVVRLAHRVIKGDSTNEWIEMGLCPKPRILFLSAQAKYAKEGRPV